MTNQEAKAIMENLIYLYRPLVDSLTAWEKAIEALEKCNLVEQYKWERDIALEQLKDIGCVLGQKMDDVKEVLGKQIPKKPIKSDREIRYCEVWKCPSCGFEWSSRVVDYCYKCGQQIDWSEED